MARNNILFSYSEDDPDAQEVIEWLASLPKGKRSKAVWRAIAEYLRGNSAEQNDGGQQDELDIDLDELNDKLASL